MKRETTLIREEIEKGTTVNFKSFVIITKRPRGFLKELDKLCDKYEINNNGTFYNFDFE